MSNVAIDTAFLDALASSEPTPGGGSAAAYAGALAAGLVSMVCRLTVGREKFAAVTPEIEAMLAKADALRTQLVGLADADMQAYGAFARAMKLPRDTAEQKQERTRQMQLALRACTLAPLHIAQSCREILDFCPELAAKGNPAAVSDVGVAAALAEASLRGAALQVLVNLAWLKDKEFIAAQKAELDKATGNAAEVKEKAMSLVAAALAG